MNIASRSNHPVAFILGVALATQAAVALAADPAAKCGAAKLTESAKLAACLLKVEAKATRLDGPVDTSVTQRCEDKFELKLTTAEDKAGGACPTTGDGDDLLAKVRDFAGGVAGAASGVRFVDNGDGTVTDHARGVIWQKQVAGVGCLACADEQRT